jgi:hypothetical protein
MSTLNVDKVDPNTGTALEIGSSGDTVTVPTGAVFKSVDKVETDKLDPESGTALEIGTSGDTINVPSGVTLDVNAGATLDATGATLTGIASIDWQAVQTSSPITGAAGKGYPVNTTSGAITLNLPAGSAGDQVSVVDYAGTFDSNALTISPNGSEKIKGLNADATMVTERQAGVFTYVDSTQGWVLTSAAPDPGVSQALFVTATGGTITTSGDFKMHTFTGDGTFAVSCAGNSQGSDTVDYLVIAGGGGGGSNGGGAGAGGYRFSNGAASGCYSTAPSPLAPLGVAGFAVPATPYPITVGDGGTGGPGGACGGGTSGSNSIFSSITSAGGGKGGSHCGPNQPGGVGGSGGGGGQADFPGPYPNKAVGNTPPSTPPQGNDGGDGSYGPDASSGGGGGIGAVGQAALPASGSPTAGGNGGTGITSCISASPVARGGGGGGGGGASGGTADSGGGAGGHSNSPGDPQPGGAGTANTGGGGGGGKPYTACGGVGGKGVVIIRYKYQ